MCELLGMSANVPTDIVFSFSGLIRRGGETGPHEDGWGIAFYQDKGCRSFHDPLASPIPRSPTSSAPTRSSPHRHLPYPQRNRGRIALENTHPFLRELWGRTGSSLITASSRGEELRLAASADRQTDSEHAFCWLMGQLRTRFPQPPVRPRLAAAIEDLSRRLASLGIFNMLLSDGRCLFCHCSTKLAWLTRRAPFGPATLIDADLTADFAQETTPTDVVTVVATRPLTRDEAWTVMQPNTTVVFRQGEVVLPARRRTPTASRRLAA